MVSFGMEDFAKRYGDLKPSQFVDVISLMGDKADNIPGRLDASFCEESIGERKMYQMPLLEKLYIARLGGSVGSHVMSYVKYIYMNSAWKKANFSTFK